MCTSATSARKLASPPAYTFLGHWASDTRGLFQTHSQRMSILSSQIVFGKVSSFGVSLQQTNALDDKSKWSVSWWCCRSTRASSPKYNENGKNRLSYPDQLKCYWCYWNNLAIQLYRSGSRQGNHCLPVSSFRNLLERCLLYSSLISKTIACLGVCVFFLFHPWIWSAFMPWLSGNPWWCRRVYSGGLSGLCVRPWRPCSVVPPSPSPPTARPSGAADGCPCMDQSLAIAAINKKKKSNRRLNVASERWTFLGQTLEKDSEKQIWIVTGLGSKRDFLS